MFIVEARNAHQALPFGLYRVASTGQREQTRNGPALVVPAPVTTVYLEPTERVSFHPLRDANPFFHLMESLWMLAGRDDVAWITQYNSTFGRFSDDGVGFHGAYGRRWRTHWDFDQLDKIVGLLKAHPKSRRAVLAMWDPQADLWEDEKGYKDIPCNTQCYLWLGPDGELNMTILCRSNDIIWGAYGANCVHFSMLQEYLAGRLHTIPGRMYQISNNFHAYEELFEKLRPLSEDWKLTTNPYATGEVSALPIMTDPGHWDADLVTFIESSHQAPQLYTNGWFKQVAEPVRRAWHEYRDKGNPMRYPDALGYADQIAATDWRKACREWLQRRQNGAAGAVG